MMPARSRLQQELIKVSSDLTYYGPFMGLGAATGMLTGYGLAHFQDKTEQQKVVSSMIGLIAGAALGAVVGRAFGAYRFLD